MGILPLLILTWPALNGFLSGPYPIKADPMRRFINPTTIISSLIITLILGTASWYVTTQVRLNSIEQKTDTAREVRDSVNKLIVELKHTNSAVLKNAERTELAYAKIVITREESLVGFLALESIATVQKSLVASVASLSTSVTELSTIIKYRNGMASIDMYSTDPHP